MEENNPSGTDVEMLRMGFQKPVAANNIQVNPTDREVKHGKGIVEQVPLHRPIIHQAFPDSLAV